MFQVKQLSKKISGKTIVKDLNFEVDYGNIAIFLGESGAGKSTVLRILNNLETYDDGIFTLDGSTLNLKDVHRTHTIGMVFQHFNLFEHLSAFENIFLPLTTCKGIEKKEAKEIANQLLKRWGLQEKSDAKIDTLSGGQKQRLAITRTLALNPKIICFDEPTSALDPRLTTQVAHFIKELALENRIILLTTHDMNLLEQLDGHLFLMEKGFLVESGSKKECLSRLELYPKLQSFLR